MEDRAQMKWAIGAAEGLALADHDDQLYPRYNYAMQLYSRSDYDGAIDEFGKVFFSGAACDTAADAGSHMSHCSALKNDAVGALAALEMTAKLYGGQQRIMRSVIPHRNDYRQRLGFAREQEVSRYIETHYHGRMERALAIKARSGSARDLAMH
jgi:hypothetical protein